MTIDIDIERLASDGSGVGRAADGRTVFVAGTLPGDTVRIRVTEDRRRLLRGELDAVLAPGPDRVTPACAVFGRCGGCSWQHIDYPAQVAAKARILTDSIQRIGQLSLPTPVSVLPSPAAYGYRGRARILVQGQRPGYRRAGSDDHVAIDDCPVLAPALRQALGELAASQAANGEWELAFGEVDGEHPQGVRLTHLDGDRNNGEPLTLLAGEHRIRIAAGGFAQANPLLFADLIDGVCREVGSGQRLLELYAGSGFFTLNLARAFQKVMAVEADATAIAHLREQAERADLTTIDTVIDDAGSCFEREALRRFDPDVLFMDPPRAGLDEAVVAAISRLAARRLVYLSCDPATLARDLKRLHQAGWQLQSVQGFDLFPQTPHVEGLAVMTR